MIMQIPRNIQGSWERHPILKIRLGFQAREGEVRSGRSFEGVLEVCFEFQVLYVFVANLTGIHLVKF